MLVLVLVCLVEVMVMLVILVGSEKGGQRGEEVQKGLVAETMVNINDKRRWHWIVFVPYSGDGGCFGVEVRGKGKRG